jgi:hypothetical protein
LTPRLDWYGGIARKAGQEFGLPPDRQMRPFFVFLCSGSRFPWRYGELQLRPAEPHWLALFSLFFPRQTPPGSIAPAGILTFRKARQPNISGNSR